MKTKKEMAHEAVSEDRRHERMERNHDKMMKRMSSKMTGSMKRMGMMK